MQGIQQFIFQTNELKDIVGASELVENICKDKFAEVLGIGTGNLKEDSRAIINAAGNVKYLFDSEDKKKLEHVVLNFPKVVVEYAPGVTISQAVVEWDDAGGVAFGDAVNELEKKLKAQRNKPMASTTTGLMGIERSRKTGLPAVKVVVSKDGNEYLDAATVAKRFHKDKTKGRKGERNVLKLAKIAFNNEDLERGDVAINTEDMTTRNDWVAVIHADGNGLGQVVQKVGKNKDDFREFSQSLDDATKEAAHKAFEEIKKKYQWKCIPIRPIVLGGDDFSVICRADLALEYVTEFIRKFEDETRDKLGKILREYEVFAGGKDYLTACAGIAYVKSSYPFYFAYDLAEALCSQAKKDTKAGLEGTNELPQSCVMFHKVQDSFVEDFEAITKRELTPNSEISFKHGPYYVEEKQGRWTVKKLLGEVKNLNGDEGNAVKSGLRRWMGVLDNPDFAKQVLERLKTIATMPDVVKTATTADGRKAVPAYDMLALHTVMYQDTKNNND